MKTSGEKKRDQLQQLGRFMHISALVLVLIIYILSLIGWTSEEFHDMLIANVALWGLIISVFAVYIMRPLFRYLTSITYMVTNLNNVVKDLKKVLPLAKEIGALEARKHRIAILVPLSDMDAHYRKETDYCLDGLYQAFNQEKYGIDDVEFIVRDHKNSEKQAASIIREELRLGTRYFISTMSLVCNNLASKNRGSFNELVQKYEKQVGRELSVKPILICTVVASQNFKIDPTSNSIFRLYIKSTNEADNIAEDVSKVVFPTIQAQKIRVCTIFSSYGQHAYLREAKDAFEKKLQEKGRFLHNTIAITSEEKVESELKDKKTEIENADAILILAGYDINSKILNTLINENMVKNDIKVITSSVFPRIYSGRIPSSPESYAAVEKILSDPQKEWYVSRPMEKIGVDPKYPKGKPFKGELSQYFMKVSILKLLKILKHEKYQGDNFSEIWGCDEIQKVPNDLIIKYSPLAHDPTITTSLFKLKNVKP